MARLRAPAQGQLAVNAPEIEPAEDEEYSLSDEVYCEEGSVASGEDGMLFPRTLCYRLLIDHRR
jgi:hypothetical protein